MRKSVKTHSGKKEQLCDICGDVGFAERLSTCYNCRTSHEHSYCMKNNFVEVPREWFCEACLSNNMKDHHEEADSSKKGKTLCTESDSSKVTESTNISPRNPVFSPPKKKYTKVVDTGKVKFIPAEDVVALTSGTHKMKASTWRRGLSSLSSQVCSSSVPHDPISRRTPISLAEASKHFSQKKSVCGSSRPPTPQMVGSVKQSSSLQQAVVKISPQDISAKEKSNETKKLDKPSGKVVVRPNDEYKSEEELVDAIPLSRKPRTPVTRTNAVYTTQNASSPFLEANPNKLPKHKELPNHPAIIPTWKGSFEILGTFSPGRHHEYEGLQAHPPQVVSRKAYEFSKQMPTTLQFKMQPRCDVWSDNIDCPTGDDIALYFLSEDFRSSKEKYHFLLEFIERGDLAMSTCLNGVELIIFTSSQLPMDSQRLNMNFFLWGVFRPSKRQVLSPSVTEATNQEVDMEIDMVGGEDIGRLDYVLKKPILEGNKVQCTIHTQKVKCSISSVLDFQKLNSSKNGDGVADCRNDESRPSSNIVSNVHSDQPIMESITLAPNIKIEIPTDFGAPPGFSRTVGSDVAQKGGVEKPLGSVPTVGRNLERPPGFSRFLKPKEMDDPSEADKKQKAVISQSSSKKENSSQSYPAKRVFRESPELPFTSQQVVNHSKNSMAPDPTPSVEKRKFQGEHCVKKEPMEETEPLRMRSLSTVYMKEEHRRKQEGFRK